MYYRTQIEWKKRPKIDARNSSYRGNRPTNKQTNRQDRLQYTAPLSLACSVISNG